MARYSLNDIDETDVISVVDDIEKWITSPGLLNFKWYTFLVEFFKENTK